MCGTFQQEDNIKLDRDAVERMKDAENIGAIQNQMDKNMNSYGRFFNDAASAPVNVLDIVGNFNKKNSALDQIMEQENF